MSALSAAREKWRREQEGPGRRHRGVVVRVRQQLTQSYAFIHCQELETDQIFLPRIAALPHHGMLKGLELTFEIRPGGRRANCRP